MSISKGPCGSAVRGLRNRWLIWFEGKYYENNVLYTAIEIPLFNMDVNIYIIEETTIVAVGRVSTYTNGNLKAWKIVWIIQINRHLYETFSRDFEDDMVFFLWFLHKINSISLTHFAKTLMNDSGTKYHLFGVKINFKANPPPTHVTVRAAFTPRIATAPYAVNFQRLRH